MTASGTDAPLEAPSVIEIRCSRPDFVVVVTDGMRRAIRGCDGALLVEDSTALAGAVTRTGDRAAVQIGDLPPQATRIVVYTAAGQSAEFNVTSDGVLRSRHVVAGPEAREAIVLRRSGSSWILRTPGTRIDDLTQHLVGIGVPLGDVGTAPVPSPAPPGPTPRAVVKPVPTAPSVPQRGRRRVLLAGAVVFVVAGAAAGFTLSGGEDAAPGPHTGADGDQTKAATTRSTPTPENEQQASQVKAALVRLPDDPAALLPAHGSGQTAASARAAVPEGTTVAVDERSWAPDGLGGGVVQVTLRTPDGERTPYVAVMVQENGEWKVLSTIPVTK